ncbi:uncharacterized protein LOC107486890 [Arachis duranensis]|uniref:Uncharacterized protein LOC107486890 n=1 Tax=Arachis duranensis TaxID=130453 RepID=A0A6P4D628_ARADU|nr:uncharacterized protein LOC107486890 [Arachis duranensis]
MAPQLLTPPTRSRLARVTRCLLTRHRHHCRFSTNATTERSKKTKGASFSGNEIKLPAALRDKNVVQLKCESSSGICDVFLVGTVYNSQRSREQVKRIIGHLKPQAVLLGLCQSGSAVLYPPIDTRPGKQPEVGPVSEFRVAFEEARKYGGKVYLGDRHEKITMARVIRKITFLDFIKLCSLPFKDVPHLRKLLETFPIDRSSITQSFPKLRQVIEHMEGEGINQEIREFKVLTVLQETVLHERDQYMSRSLLEVAKKNNCVVAVVGKGHLSGIKKHWQQDISVAPLLQVPPSKHTIMKLCISVSVVMVGVSMIGRYL